MKTSIAIIASSLILAVFFTSCSKQESTMTRQSFGKTPDGTEVFLYTLRNKNGMEARISNYGGILVSLLVADHNGKPADVVLGFDSLASYIKDTPYFGALIGRYGNRIGKGTFRLGGVKYTLAINNGANHLHGGLKGFDKVVWSVDEKASVPVNRSS